MSELKIIKGRIRAYLLSSDTHKEPLHSFEGNYAKVNKPLNIREFGFNSLLSFLQSMPEAVRITKENGITMLVGVPTSESSHIVTMIDKQKKSRKKGKRGRDTGIFPRYLPHGRGYSGFYPYHHYPSQGKLPQHNYFRTAMPPPRPRPFPPTFSKKPHVMTKLAPAPNFSAKLKPTPGSPTTPATVPVSKPNPDKKESVPVKRVPVHERLGPLPNTSSASARQVVVSSKSSNLRRNIGPFGDENTDPQLPGPPSTSSAEGYRTSSAVVLVDPSTSDESVESADDSFDKLDTRANSFIEESDFLRLFVRHLLATTENIHSRTFTPSGITSRMRRVLSRVGIDLPPYISDVIKEYMVGDWKDIFELKSNLLTGEPDSTSEFIFSKILREAYQKDIRKLPEQVTLSNKGNHRVKICHVENDDFYVTIFEDPYTSDYERMAISLQDEVETDDDTFTYRVNELCVVFLEKASTYVRGRLLALRIKSSNLDHSKSQLFLMAVVILVDTGETVNVPAGDIYPLPSQWFNLPPRAYRCEFTGGVVRDGRRFSEVMSSYLDKVLDLTIFAQHRTYEGLTLQVQLLASSYISDDLIQDKVLTRVTLNDPPSKEWSPNENTRIRFVDWHGGYRSVLVQFSSPKELRELNNLEKELFHLYKANTAAAAPLEMNLYAWKGKDSCRRVRILAQPGERWEPYVYVQCLDHGCRCKAPREELYLPIEQKAREVFVSRPYYTASLHLAVVPEISKENDLMKQMNMKRKIRELVDKEQEFLARTESSLSEETKAFTLHYLGPSDSDDDIQFQTLPSLNVRFLSVFMNMTNWEFEQPFKALLTPVNRDAVHLPSPDWFPWYIRFDIPGCMPNFERPAQESRFMETCLLDFTQTDNDTKSAVLLRLTELPPNNILHGGTIVVYRTQEKNEPRAVRVRLVQSYSSQNPNSVQVRLVDNPTCTLSYEVNPQKLFTVPDTDFGRRPLDELRVDATRKELERFVDLLQNLPPFDQLVITVDKETADFLNNLSSPEPVDLKLISIQIMREQKIPVVKLASI